MGKIMRNGNKYSSASPNNAQSVVYDNTDSGLNAENAKEAIDELNKKIGIYNIDEFRAGYEQSADLTFLQWKKGDVIWSLDTLCSDPNQKARLMVSLNNGVDWIELWKPNSSFVDTSKVIQAKKSGLTTSEQYVATEDCAILYELVGEQNKSSHLAINGVTMHMCFSSGTTTIGGIAYLKKGDVATFPMVAHAGTCYTVYGLR